MILKDKDFGKIEILSSSNEDNCWHSARIKYDNDAYETSPFFGSQKDFLEKVEKAKNNLLDMLKKKGLFKAN